MNEIRFSRREWCAATVTALAAGLAPAADRTTRDPFGYCLNTSTIREQKLSLPEKIDIAASAGYQGIEPWTRELDQFVQEGGNLKDLGKRIHQHGMSVESVIGFFEWIVDDDARRAKGLEEARRCLDMVQKIGGKRLAAPPMGATNQVDLSLLKAAERYRGLLEIGDQFGVSAELEFWGFSKCLSRLGEAAQVAIQAGHPRACILADVYHLYKGGSELGGFKLLAGGAISILHCNDYPASPPRASITDAHRIYPGDGIAPFKTLLRDLRDIGFRGMLSLELFNREYWMQDAATVARTGLEKMRAVVRASLE